MPRPQKLRCCRHLAEERFFKPRAVPMHELKVTHLLGDEFEALRLCDLEKKTQEEAGATMGVSRGTVQRLLVRGREKIIGALLRGEALEIKNMERGNQAMKVCFPVRGQKGLEEEVHNHFGSAPYFVIYDTGEGTTSILENGNLHHSHGSCQPLAALKGQRVDAVVCGGMGHRAISLLNQDHIKVYLTPGGTGAEVLEKILNDDLPELTPAMGCAHHGQGGHGCQ